MPRDFYLILKGGDLLYCFLFHSVLFGITLFSAYDGQVCNLVGGGGVLQQLDAVEGGQGVGVLLALEHGHAALIVGKVAGLGQPLDVQHAYSMVMLGYSFWSSAT